MTDHDISFEVKFVHRLRQTDDVSQGDFSVLEDVLLGEQSTPPKVLFCLDSNLEDGEFANQLITRLQTSERLRLVREPMIIPGGESCKNSEHTLRDLLAAINSHDLDRRSYIVVAGGGAVLDAVGFAAAIAHRGIRLIRLPSTTLAQADSGVGVKNAINYFDKKNWIGTFAVPWAVFNDTAILRTLPDRDFRSGLTEAVKVALLKDAAFFDFLRKSASKLRRRAADVSKEAIARSCQLHLDHITAGGDPFEALEARPLDFGHWSAHRMEPMTNYALRHGEAVGIGVALDTLYSARKFGFPQPLAHAVCQTLVDLGTPLWCDQLNSPDNVLQGLEEFRQHLGGRLTVTMLKNPGEAINVHEIDIEVMKSCIGELHDIAERENA
ncbi:3-dehydroquinate synthase [Rhodopirellula sp. JC740]|uniref:3-dehydroquinate synthase n=1 Tax=Rhodopirellula halodulae TaxID=2894198 RepID=A0ABS8NDC6_9BACT|nr:3-dehydroquinate synthase [Rhodopirellula sp. JC740]MCC9641560.1 3-dehydroquinate synthase [Rhodopirellula sp. JC740]